MTTSLSPSQETYLKIVMSSTFSVRRMPIVHPLIGYNVDEVANMDSEIVHRIIEWDCSQASTIDMAICVLFDPTICRESNIKHQ